MTTNVTCPACETKNPSANLHCGNCGAILSKTNQLQNPSVASLNLGVQTSVNGSRYVLFSDPAYQRMLHDNVKIRKWGNAGIGLLLMLILTNSASSLAGSNNSTSNMYTILLAVLLLGLYTCCIVWCSLKMKTKGYPWMGFIGFFGCLGILTALCWPRKLGFEDLILANTDYANSPVGTDSDER